MPAVISDLWIKVLQTGAARIYGVLLGIATLAVTARWLGPEGRGEVAAITIWATLVATFAGLSLGQVALHRAAQDRSDNWLGELLSLLITMVVTLSAIGWVVVTALFLLTDGEIFGSINPAWLALGMLLVPISIWEQYGSALLQALDRLDIYNRYQMIGRTSATLLVLWFVVGLEFGVPSVLLGNLVGGLVVAVGGLFFLAKTAQKLALPTLQKAASFVGSGLQLHLTTLGAFLITASDVLMLNYFRGSAETGIYQLGVQLIGIMVILPQVTAMVIYGRITTLDRSAAWRAHRTLLWQTTSVILVIGFLAGVTAPVWLVAIAGDAFLPTVDIFRWQLLTLVGMSFSILMAPQWIARGYFWQASAMTMTVGVGNVLANAWLIPRYGMYGAVWASIAVYGISIIGNGAMLVVCNRAEKGVVSEAGVAM